MSSEKHSFQAEVKQVLDIVVNSLYTDKEIFIRELISNASDSLEKLRHIQLTESDIFDDKLDLEINISTDETAGTITIQDFGIGMSKEDLVENLGTIAHSGSKSFLNKIKEKGENNENLIGQFGVGFYSAFMVAKEVKVYTHAWNKDEKSYLWSCDGSGDYEIEESEGQRRGAKIVISLKDDEKEFSKEERVKAVVNRFSSFVQYPINVNGEKIKTIDAIWLRNKSDITEEDYTEFYKFQANAFDEPLTKLHFSADAPIAVNALLFIPKNNPEKFGLGKIDPSVSLHCRKVLIDSKPKDLLPDWLRFLKGVIDSADLPLNISRESMQDSALVQKINKVITKRLLKFLDKESKKNKDLYKEFWGEFGIFLKEGVTSDFTHKEQISKLIRFESSFTEKGELTSFEEYVTRMKEEQKEIYYLYGASRETIEAGPYVEAFKARQLEVIYLYEQIDEFVMNNLFEFDKKSLKSADADEINLDKVEDEEGVESLDETEVKDLITWIKSTLGDKVSEVETSDRLIGSPACLLTTENGMTANMRKVMKAMKQDTGMPDSAPKFQINAKHDLIKDLSKLYQSNQDTAQLILEQILDNTFVTSGILEDPREMLERNYRILQSLAKQSL